MAIPPPCSTTAGASDHRRANISEVTAGYGPLSTPGCVRAQRVYQPAALPERRAVVVCPVDYGEHLKLTERLAPSSAPSEGITIAGLSGGAYMRVDGAARGHARKFQREGCPHAEGPHPRR